MVSLVWKEARERLLWAVALVLISAHAAWTRGYTFYGSPGPEMVSWSMGPVLMALLMGASSFASELTSNRGAFLLTRAVSWKSIVTAKLAVSMIALAAAAATAAVVYGLACPEAYAQCVTSQRLFDGACLAMIFTSLAFLVGWSCSSVLSGAAESGVFVVVQALALVYLFGLVGAWSERWSWQIVRVMWPVPLLAAGTLIVRFGLTLPPRERLRRYTIAASAGITLLACLVHLTPDGIINRVAASRLSRESINWSISPDGLYAFGRDMSDLYWLDIRRNRLVRLESVLDDYSGRQVVLEDVGWAASHTAYRLGYGKDSWFIRTYSPQSDRTKRRDIPMGELSDLCGYPSEISTSPDGRFAAVSLSFAMDMPQSVVFAEIAAGRRLRHELVRPVGGTMWWEAPEVFCVTDVKGETHKVLL